MGLFNSKREPLQTTVSMSRKINLGNYESADVFVSVQGIKADTTREEIDAALAAGALGYEALKVALVAKIKDLRADVGLRGGAGK